MQFNVVFTDEADDTFDSIGNQILERWGAAELFKFRARVYDIVERLSKFPLIFQAVKVQPILEKRSFIKTAHGFIRLMIKI